MDDWKKDLNAKQLAAIPQLREKVADVLPPNKDDYYLWRWLKARNFDVGKAETMLRNNLAWRKSYGADTILTDWTPPEVLQKHYPGGVFGHDKEGHPIVWQLSKEFDSRTMLKCVKKADIVKFHIYRIEKMMKLCEENSQKFGKRIGSSMHISDLDGLSLSMVFTPGISEAMKEVFKLSEANYPENLYTSYVINAPAIFPVIFNILRPFLSEDTKRKVHMLGRNWQDEIAKVVDMSSLPVYWGGQQREPDDHCSNHITICSPIPKHFLLSEQLSVDRGSMKTFTVLRGSKHILHEQVTKPGTVVSWVFETDDYDINFGVSYCKEEDDIENYSAHRELSPQIRVDSHLVPEDGTLTCAEPGFYLLIFDNNFSWVNSKIVHYKLEKVEPCEDFDTGELLTTIKGKLESTHL